MNTIKTITRQNAPCAYDVGFKALAFSLLCLGLSACGASTVKPNEKAVEGYREAGDLRIVDCLLPGHINRLGNMTYVSDRRAIRTTTTDCGIRGGEYVAYDRADYRSALNVWLKSAEKGDPEAQTYVGEIFEKGLGRDNDYTSAALWYEKAAAQGYKRAQINLGYLYENGLGVDKDVAKALNFYRVAAGSQGELIFSSDAAKELEATRETLEQKLAVASREKGYLESQLAKAQQQDVQEQQQTTRVETAGDKRSGDTSGRANPPVAADNLANANQQIEVLQQLYDRSQQQLSELSTQIASLPPAGYRILAPQELLTPPKLELTEPLTFKDINFGRYYALIIGNQDYLYLDDLESPRKDALRLQEILENKYGFRTMMLHDAGEKEILNAFNELYKQIQPEDNLLVFYAGHGVLSESANSQRKRGYWLPTDARQNVTTNWINNSVISDHLDRIKARSILVVSDSCFAGNLASEKSAFLLGGVNVSLSESSIKVGVSRRSRIVISSGGDKPVLDGSQGQHSIFANALINLLENNQNILRDNMLFSQVAVNVRQQAKLNQIEQTPEMRPIRAAGHEGGDFYFVPVGAQQNSARFDTGTLSSPLASSAIGDGKFGDGYAALTSGSDLIR